MPEMRGTPIIGLSANCEDGWCEQAIAAGCHECIQKPIDEQVLDEIASEKV
jgi:CheY-like chemotaxis protein